MLSAPPFGFSLRASTDDPRGVEELATREWPGIAHEAMWSVCPDEIAASPSIKCEMGVTPVSTNTVYGSNSVYHHRASSSEKR